jgi:hypothetical protein
LRNRAIAIAIKPNQTPKKTKNKKQKKNKKMVPKTVEGELFTKYLKAKLK